MRQGIAFFSKLISLLLLPIFLVGLNEFTHLSFLSISHPNSFDLKVFEVVSQVPHGHAASYVQSADVIGEYWKSLKESKS